MKEKRSERLKKVVGLTVHIDEANGQEYRSVRVGEDLVKRIKSSRQNGYVLRKGHSVKELFSEWQELPYPMTKIDALKFAAYDPNSKFIHDQFWVDAFEEKIQNIESRLHMEEHRKPRKPRVDTVKIQPHELLSILQSDAQPVTEVSEHVNMG